MEKKNMVLLTVIAVATLLVAVVGATFAYFTATITDNRPDDTNNGTTKVNAGSVAGATVVGTVEGAAGSFEVTDVYPGHKEVAALQVNVTDDNNRSSKVNIMYDATTNGFPKDSIKLTVYKNETKVSTDGEENYFKCEKVTGTAGDDTTFYENCTVAESTLGTKVKETLLDTGASSNLVLATDTITGSAAPGKTVYYYVVAEYVNKDNASQNADFNKALDGKVTVKLAA